MSKIENRMKGIAAILIVFALITTGTFAWVNFSQNVLNEFRSVGERRGNSPGGTTHDDFDEPNKDIYVENWGDMPIFVRIRLDEYMEIGGKSLIAGAEKNDPGTWTAHIPYNGHTNICGEGANFHEYWEWEMGGSKIYRPADESKRGNNGYVEQNKEVYTRLGAGLKETLPGEVITREKWAKRGHRIGNNWVIDTDGWAYWSAPLKPGEATGLLLNAVKQNKEISEEYYYAINVVVQMATETGEYNYTNFYDNSDRDHTATANGKSLLYIVTQYSHSPYNDIHTYVGTDETYSLYRGTMPCVGTPKVVVFVIDFPNDTQSGHPWQRYSVADIEKHFFDKSMINEPANVLFENEYNSLRDFYYRSSYGKLDITGDVIGYTMQKKREEYKSAGEIVHEVMAVAGTEDAVDWSKYDANNDGCIDGVYFVLRNMPAFATPDFVMPSGYTRAGKGITRYAFIVDAGSSPSSSALAHETVHMMGLTDVYCISGVNNEGTGANSIMDGQPGVGDLFGMMKYVFNWIEPIKIDKKGETNVTMASISDKPQCAIIYPNGDKDNLNWFVVEYITKSNNNLISPDKPGGGLRIWRATMNPDFLYSVEIYPVTCISPYIYIEAVHPPGIRDYFLYPGDSFTPHTTLNSNYPLSFAPNGSGGIVMQNLTDSGIYLDNIVIENGLAHFTVNIK